MHRTYQAPSASIDKGGELLEHLQKAYKDDWEYERSEGRGKATTDQGDEQILKGQGPNLPREESHGDESTSAGSLPFRMKQNKHILQASGHSYSPAQSS